MKTCPHCQHPIEDSARFCLYCATSLDEKRLWAPRRRHPRLYKVIALLCVAALTVTAIRQWPREELPLTDAPAVSMPVDGITADSDADGTTASGTAESGTDGTTTPSSAGGSTTLTVAPTTTTTKAPLLSFFDNLFGKNTTTTTKTTATTTTATTTTASATQNPTSSTTTRPTSSTTTRPTSSTTKPSAITTTLPPRTTVYNPNRTPLATPAGMAQLVGQRVWFRSTENFIYVEGSHHEDACWHLYIEITDVNCYLAQDPYDATQYLYIDIVCWLPESNYMLTPDSRLVFNIRNGDNVLYARGRFDELMPGNYTTMTIIKSSDGRDCPLLGPDFTWTLDAKRCPIDYQVINDWII